MYLNNWCAHNYKYKYIDEKCRNTNTKIQKYKNIKIQKNWLSKPQRCQLPPCSNNGWTIAEIVITMSKWKNPTQVLFTQRFSVVSLFLSLINHLWMLRLCIVSPTYLNLFFCCNPTVQAEEYNFSENLSATTRAPYTCMPSEHCSLCCCVCLFPVCILLLPPLNRQRSGIPEWRRIFCRRIQRTAQEQCCKHSARRVYKHSASIVCYASTEQAQWKHSARRVLQAAQCTE